MGAASSPNATATPRALAYAAPALLAALALALALRPIDDGDVWYHLAAGRSIWQAGAWPVTNTFSFSAPSYPWLDQHWAFQVVLYAVHRIAGVGGCIVFVGVAAVATASILYAHARRFVRPSVAASVVALALLVASPRLQPRPEVLSFILVALFLTLLDDHPRRGRSLYWLVPLEIVWVNTDGSFAIGLGLIGCHWLGAVLAFLPLPRGMRVATRCDQRGILRGSRQLAYSRSSPAC